MKNRKYILVMALFTLLISCNDGIDGSGSTPDCDWGKDEKVSFDKLELKVPGGMNNWWKGIFPTDNVIRSLWSLMNANGDYSNTNKAMASGTIIGGQGCKGYRNYIYSYDDPKIEPKSVKAPFPNNGFVVEAKVRVRSDDFWNSGFSGGSAYFVYWERTSNTLPLNGNIWGTKQDFNPRSGRVSKKGYIIQGDSKNYY